MTTDTQLPGKQLLSLLVGLLLIFSCSFPALIPQPVQAAYEQAIIQTTIDVDNWDILAAPISLKSGGWSGLNKPIEADRVGADMLSKLAKSNYPSGVAGLEWKPNGALLKSDGKNLVLSFPGFTKSDSTVLHTSSTSKDFERASLVRTTLIYDLNMAFKTVYGNDYVPSGKTREAKIDSYMADMKAFLSKIDGRGGTLNGASISFGSAVDKKVFPDEVTNSSDFVTITKNGKTQVFQFRIPKGYVSVSGRGDVPEILGLTTVDDSKDAAFVDWGDLVAEAFINYNQSDEKLIVTSDELYGTPSSIEKSFGTLLESISNWLTVHLGLWSFDELVFNSGIRGTSVFAGGIFPSAWQPVIWAFFFIFELIALVLLLWSIIYNVGKKALSTTNPVARAAAIEQIEYLFLVGIILTLLPAIIHIVTNMSFHMTGMLSDAIGDTTARERFRSLTATSRGVLPGLLTNIVFLGAVVYFNIFYLLRAFTIALLIITAPFFVSCMSISESKRRLTAAWVREFAAALFIQPLQALAFSFLLIAPQQGGGRNIDTIVYIYALIPLTHLLRGLFFEGGGGLLHEAAERGKQKAKNEGSRAGRTAAAMAGEGLAGGIRPLRSIFKGDDAEGTDRNKSDASTSSRTTTAKTSTQTSPDDSSTMQSDSDFRRKADFAQKRNSTAGPVSPGKDIPIDVGESHSPSSGESHSDGHILKSAAMAAGAVGLGMIGGGMHSLNRQTLNLGNGKTPNFVTQASNKLANNAYALSHPQSSEPIREDAYTKGLASKFEDSQSGKTFYSMPKSKQEEAGISVSTRDNEMTLAYNDLSKLSPDQRDNLENLAHGMTNPDTRADLNTMGIKDVSRMSMFNPQTGQDEIYGYRITGDADKMDHYFGLSSEKDSLNYKADTPNDSPDFVPNPNRAKQAYTEAQKANLSNTGAPISHAASMGNPLYDYSDKAVQGLANTEMSSAMNNSINRTHDYHMDRDHLEISKDNLSSVGIKDVRPNGAGGQVISVSPNDLSTGDAARLGAYADIYQNGTDAQKKVLQDGGYDSVALTRNSTGDVVGAEIRTNQNYGQQTGVSYNKDGLSAYVSTGDGLNVVPSVPTIDNQLFASHAVQSVGGTLSATDDGKASVTLPNEESLSKLVNSTPGLSKDCFTAGENGSYQGTVSFSSFDSKSKPAQNPSYRPNPPGTSVPRK